MKYIVAIIQPGRLTAVHEALAGIGIEGLTTSEVQGYGRQKGKSEMYRGEIGRAHVRTPVTEKSRMPSSA